MIIALFSTSAQPFPTVPGIIIRHGCRFEYHVLISLVLRKGQFRPAKLRYGRGAASRSPTPEPQTKHSQTLMKPYQQRQTSYFFFCIPLTHCRFPRHPHLICVQQPRTATLPCYLTSSPHHEARSPRTSNGDYIIHISDKSEDFLLWAARTIINLFYNHVRVAVIRLGWDHGACGGRTSGPAHCTMREIVVTCRQQGLRRSI